MYLTRLEHEREMLKLPGKVSYEAAVEVRPVEQAGDGLAQDQEETLGRPRVEAHSHPDGVHEEPDEPHHLPELGLVGGDLHAA